MQGHTVVLGSTNTSQEPTPTGLQRHATVGEDTFQQQQLAPTASSSTPSSKIHLDTPKVTSAQRLGLQLPNEVLERIVAHLSGDHKTLHAWCVSLQETPTI
ncbi:hypothetical protein IAT40_004607 [Kwoniella sp. CBS 6097]